MPDSVPTGPTNTDFSCFYLYGLSNQPYRQSVDLGKFGELYSLIIGNHGGLSLASSFHPYQLMNPAGISVCTRPTRSFTPSPTVSNYSRK